MVRKYPLKKLEMKIEVDYYHLLNASKACQVEQDIHGVPEELQIPHCGMCWWDE